MNGLPGFEVPAGSTWYDHGEPRAEFGTGGGPAVHHGLEAAFLRELAAAGATARFAKHGLNGTSISSWLDTHADELIDQCAANSLDPDVFIWMQGAADAQSQAAADAYRDRLAELVGRLREAWGEDLFVVVVGLRTEEAPYPYAEDIRTHQREFAEADSDAVYLDVSAAGLQADGVHMTGTSPGCDPEPEGVGVVGRLAAAAVLQH
jgi:hypothetical protein